MSKTLQVKYAGEVQQVKTSNGSVMAKRNIVLTEKECRTGENGLYLSDVDYAIDLLGDRATQFDLNPGDWIVANLTMSAREYNGVHYPEVRLLRYLKLA